MAKHVAFCTNELHPDRHDWWWVAVVGMSQCRACGVVGVCSVCYQKLGKPIPNGVLVRDCPEHFSLGVKQGESTSGV
jgi:hypothetical protein